MTIAETFPEWRRGTATPGGKPVRGLIRELLGRAHYERMRAGMAPTLDLPSWEALSGPQREFYRARLDYLVPPLLAMTDYLRQEARDDMHADLLDEGIA